MVDRCISVCVATYKRPNLLSELLESLARQRLKDPRIRVIVVDNDSEGSARRTVQAFRETNTLEVLYDIEPKQGISYARNRALQHVSTGYIAFLDDDETVPQTWLETMWFALFRFKADAVFGPVIKCLPHDTPSWAKSHPSFMPVHRPSGTAITHGGAGNVLMRSAALGHPPHTFDSAFALTGGEDVDYFYRLHLSGRRLIWCDEAKAYERVPPERVTIGWVCRRAFRGGQTFARIFLRQYGALKKLIWLFHKPFQIFLAAIGLPFVAFVSYAGFIRLLCRICAASGQISAMSGDRFLHKEYDPKIYRPAPPLRD